jgi:hypothetical protein
MKEHLIFKAKWNYFLIYSAPEAKENGNYNYLVDIYSLGLVLGRLLTLEILNKNEQRLGNMAYKKNNNNNL